MKGLWILPAAASLSLAVTAGDDAKALPEGPGKEIVVKACIDCHGAANFRKMRISEDEWWEKVGDMVDRGAKATEPEQTAIVAYLAKNFGKDSKVNMNTAPNSELMVVLGFTIPEAQAIVAWREGGGNFQEWRDLLKVPSLDARKVEAKKERMSF
jgi:competence protein ComEA